MIGIVNFFVRIHRQILLIGLPDDFDHPTSRIDSGVAFWRSFLANSGKPAGRIQFVESSQISPIFSKLGLNIICEIT